MAESLPAPQLRRVKAGPQWSINRVSIAIDSLHICSSAPSWGRQAGASVRPTQAVSDEPFSQAWAATKIKGRVRSHAVLQNNEDTYTERRKL